MPMPQLLLLPSEAAYKSHFVENYCNTSPMMTYDGLPVMFYPDMFEHAFYKRTEKKWSAPKSEVDWERCKRMMWIQAVLSDNTIIPRKGYDKATGKYDNSRRVTLVSQDRYVVVIRCTGRTWRFVTAYLIDNEKTMNKLLSAPVWVHTAAASR